jgi:hypothetical protein
MPSYIQIGDDPTRWWIADGFNASQLTGQPVLVTVNAPLAGTMVISSKFASLTIFGTSSPPPPEVNTTPGPTIYVPTATGVNPAHGGYELPDSTSPPNLAEQIAAAMRAGHNQTVTLAGGGTLVLDGASLAFVVIKPGAVGDSSAHG